MLTAQRVRTKDRQPIIKYTEDEVKALAGRTYMKAVQQQKSKGIEPGLARQLAEEYGRYHWTFLIDTTQEIRSLFESQGFGWILSHVHQESWQLLMCQARQIRGVPCVGGYLQAGCELNVQLLLREGQCLQIKQTWKERKPTGELLNFIAGSPILTKNQIANIQKKQDLSSVCWFANLSGNIDSVLHFPTL